MIITNSSTKDLLFTPLVPVNSFNPISSPSSFKGIPQPLAQQLKMYECDFANH